MKCPSLDYVYRMSWSEFRIRLHGYRRSQLRELKLHRELLWVIYGNGLGEKKVKTIQEFYPIDGEIGIPNDMLEDMKDRQKRAREKYNKEKNG